mmetsp:Transcript_141560/g.394545  ORF Transcript_141560/g.394545 Transcript_141560/m.394545 type:complete len:240 (+) Transcript_141560:152-871(+)
MFTPEMMLPTGPPPQAVLDQRWLWHLLLILLGVTFLLRLIGLDIAGALLSGLMLCFGIIMTRDGMQEMAKYALVYAVLCGLNFFFDILPLITELGGRVSRTTEPVAASSSVEGVHQTTYTLTTKTTPFFDSDQGILYNVQSLAMVVSPICMGLGVYLAISANNEIQRSVPNLFDENVDFAPRQPAPLERGPASRLGGTGGAAQRSVGGSSSGAASSSRTGGSSVRDGFERFQGQAHKLG